MIQLTNCVSQQPTAQPYICISHIIPCVWCLNFSGDCNNPPTTLWGLFNLKSKGSVNANFLHHGVSRSFGGTRTRMLTIACGTSAICLCTFS